MKPHTKSDPADPRPRGITARKRAEMAKTHLDLADEQSQPKRLEHQEAAQHQLKLAREALDYEMEQDR